MRSPGRAVGATVLCFEALVVFFAGLVAKDLSRLGQGQALGFAGALAVALVLTAGLLGRPFGRVLGSVMQVAVVAAGFWVPAMFLVGPIFVLLWVVALRLEVRFGGPPAAGPPAGPPSAGPTSAGGTTTR